MGEEALPYPINNHIQIYTIITHCAIIVQQICKKDTNMIYVKNVENYSKKAPAAKQAQPRCKAKKCALRTLYITHIIH